MLRCIFKGQVTSIPDQRTPGLNVEPRLQFVQKSWLRLSFSAKSELTVENLR